MAGVACVLIGGAGLYLALRGKKREERVREPFRSKSEMPALPAPDIGPVASKREKVIQSSSDAQRKYQSLTGEKMAESGFSHNNMVHFYGSRIRGPSLGKHPGSTLDNMQGAGSTAISKEERAPLFQPHKDLGFANGAPNTTEFVRERQVPSLRAANQKPWEEQRVAPGLGMGYTVEGGPGYNSGVDSREKWLPKTCNELRVDTNPKMTFGLEGLEGPAMGHVVAPTQETAGTVVKKLPDASFEQTCDMWLPGVANVKRETQRGANTSAGPIRGTSNVCRFGGGSDTTGGYMQQEFRDSKRHETCGRAIPKGLKQDVDVLKGPEDGSRAKPTNRSSACQKTFMGSVQGALKAAVSPLIDSVRPTKKGGCTSYVGGALGGGDQSGAPRPSSVAHRTMRETNHCTGPEHWIYQGGVHEGSVQPQQQAQHTKRSDSCREYVGGAGVSSGGIELEVAASRRQSRPKDTTAPGWMPAGAMSMAHAGQNIQIRKRDSDRDATGWIGMSGPSATPSIDSQGGVRRPQAPKSRDVDPSLVDAFKSNPYTQPLNSVA